MAYSEAVSSGSLIILELKQIMAKDSKNADSYEAVPASLSNSAGFLLNMAARSIREKVTAALEPLGMTTQELGLLRILDGQGANTQQALCNKHNIDRTTMVQIVDRLEERQLVMRQQSTEDRRANLIHLTPRGRKTLAKANRLTKKQQEQFLMPLSETEWEALRQSLIKLLVHHGRGKTD